MKLTHVSKAQITIEYLLLFAFFLGFLGISIYSLSTIKESFDRSNFLSTSRGIADEFLDKVEIVCSLGHGTRLAFDFDGKLETADDIFTINSEISSKSTCIFHDKYIFSGGKVTIENFYGEILLS